MKPATMASEFKSDFNKPMVAHETDWKSFEEPKKEDEFPAPPVSFSFSIQFKKTLALI